MRALRRGSFFNSQGLLAPDILVTKAEFASGEPDVLVDAVVQFCRWCVDDAALVRGEVQPDAWLIGHTSYYISQVGNGGHGQFASNSDMNAEVLDDIEAGLTQLQLKYLLEIFCRFRGELSNDALKQVVIDGGGFGEIPRVIAELDEAFHHSPDPGRFRHQAMQWLKEAPTVLAVSPRELRERQKAILTSNRLLEHRRKLTSQSLWTRLTAAAARLWDRTNLRRPGESDLDQVRRRIAADRPVAWQINDLKGNLIQRVYPAVLGGNDEEVDRIFAEFRDLHARFRLHAIEGWPEHIRMYASKLHYAGEQLGRCDLLEQAADAFGQTIATGAVYVWDAGFDWRSLGHALVELGRLDKSKIPGVTEGINAFTNALAADAPAPDIYSRRLRSLLGLAEAHLVIAAANGGAEHIDAARETLDKARPLLKPDERCRWGALDAELLVLMPGKLRSRERERALRQLEKAITWETENDGDPRANPQRLRRLHELRDRIAGVADNSMGQGGSA